MNTTHHSLLPLIPVGLVVCPWCGAENIIKPEEHAPLCPVCGHRADCERVSCDCRGCQAEALRILGGPEYYRWLEDQP